MKHRIEIQQFSDQWIWVYYVGSAPRARSQRMWPSLAHASRSARSFRELLVAADICEIVPPLGHKYSGG